MKIMIDWADETMLYALRNADRHLSESSPSPELMAHLQAISFKCLLDNAYRHTLVDTEDYHLIFIAWERMFYFISAIQNLVNMPTHSPWSVVNWEYTRDLSSLSITACDISSLTKLFKGSLISATQRILRCLFYFV